MDEEITATGEATNPERTPSVVPELRDKTDAEETNLKEAESFLNALGEEVMPAESFANNGLTLTSEDTEGAEEQHTPRSRRESQIWDGAFVEESPRKLKRSRPALTNDDEPGPPKVRYIDMESEAAHAARVELPRSSPGLWVVEQGLRTTGIAILSFDVGTEMALAAKRWCEGPDHASKETDHLRVILGCYPENELSSRSIDANLPNAQEEIRNAKSAWSSTCLCIQIDGHVWSPFDLISQEGPIDITQFIRPGKNELELVQISGTSGVVFVVSAAHPSDQEYQYARKTQRLHYLIRSGRRPADSLLQSS